MSATLEGTRALEHALACATRAGARQADALLEESDALEARVRGESLDFVKQSRERTLGIRALVAGGGGLRQASTSTSDLSTAAIERMAEETVALARATAPDAHAGLPEDGFVTDAPELALFDPADREIGVEARIEDARRAEEAARSRDARIVNSEGSQVRSVFSRLSYGSSAGFLGRFESATHSLFSEPVARAGASMQRDYWLTVGRSLDSLEAPASVGRRAADRALARLGARRVSTCEVPVIFEPLSARSLLGHLVACVSGYAVYRKASYLAGRLGEAVAAPSITVVDDGRLPGALGSSPFDAEGLPTRRTVLVEEGVLRSYLLDSYSARKLGLGSTGNARRRPGGGGGVSPTNLWIEPGELSLEEIVADTERGLLVTELIGMGFNPVTGDYSRGAAGMWIEQGRIAYPVEEITVAGTFAEMLTGIDAVGSDLLRLGPVSAPSLRVARMTVAGESP